MKTRVIQQDSGDVTPTAPHDPVEAPAPPPDSRARTSAQRGGRPSLSRSLVWALLVVLVLSCAYLASSPGSADVSSNRDSVSTSESAAIEYYVEGEMSAQRIPGLSLGIVRDGQTVHLQGFGEADTSGREVTPQTPFIIGSLSKSFTALAIMQLVEAGQVDLDAPVRQYIPWFRVSDAAASRQITVRQLLNQTSGISPKTGKSFQGNGDVSDKALERAVRKLGTAELSEPVGSTFQYSTVNYAVLGLIVQEVSGESYEEYVQQQIFTPLGMQHSFTSEADAEPQGLATGHNYWFGRPAAADVAYNRGILPAGYLISSAEDMTHYLIAQLSDGSFDGTAVLSPAGTAEMHRAAVPTLAADTSYGMGWFVGPVNGLPAVFHQGETFTYHANIVLLPDSDEGVVILMNAENSVDLFTRGRMGTIASGVASLLEGQQPPTPPSRAPLFVVFTVLFGAVCIQAAGMFRSISRLRRRQLPTGRFLRRTRIVLSMLANFGWASLVLVLLPKQLGVPLLTLTQGLPDIAYTLLVSGSVALVWAVARTVWALLTIRAAHGHTNVNSVVPQQA
jgi:CubicO group peptidase (beta-lactamase class C family)